MPFYLGLDAGTQSLTAVLIRHDDHRREMIAEESIAYDETLPHYGTRHGVLAHADPSIVHAPPLMWADALDRAIADLARHWPAEMTRLAAVSGTGQQHGSVCLNERALLTFRSLSPHEALAPQLVDVFSRATAPVWLDSSTTPECREIAQAVGGDDRIARHTGSRTFERFTGPQIRRFFKTDPAAYAATSRIHLVSSFLASLLAGTDAPIEPGDASGMNLMDLMTCGWWPPALEATAPGLAGRLPAIVRPDTIVGRLARYWRRRHDLPPARVVVWTGDNPSSAIGTGIVAPGRVAISLGTSDTVFGVMTEPRVNPDGEGHVFGAASGGYLALTCFANGSLARERIRDHFGLDWEGFSAALRATPPGNGGALLLPWFVPEITPFVPAPAAHRLDLDEADAPRHVRAIIEAQMMSMANHSRWMSSRIDAIHATGGASASPAILQVMADVFGTPVYRWRSGHSAALGAALRAVHADVPANGVRLDWTDVLSSLAEPDETTRIDPVSEHVLLHADLRRRYAAFEKSYLGLEAPSSGSATAPAC